MYTLKSILRRGTPLAAVAAIVTATMLPAAAVFADSLNPLTERSLLLSSSAPGFTDTDGAGNSESHPNSYNGGESYAPPGSGPNGKKSGETFTFRVSTDSVDTSKTIKTFSLQYCTGAAGNCQAPGDNTGDARTPDREDNATAHAKVTPTSDFDVVSDGTTPWSQGTGAGQFQIFKNGTAVTSTDWVMSTLNVEDTAHSGALTGKKNYIALTSTTGVAPVFNDKIEIKFNPSSTNYITNPGSGSFFVKINTYTSAPGVAAANLMPTTNANVIDGGVTVANVMTDSIHITTKVLETMAFSVGTQNPDTQAVQHGSCDAMNVINNNRLNLGDPDAEYSLQTGKAWDVNSYWRLSSNSSGGATVYYSGDTLRNTVGDHIADMPVKAHSQPGTEQFGLALIDAGKDTLDGGSFPTNHVTPTIDPLDIETPYADGGYVSNTLLPISSTTTANNAEFAFKASSQTTPEVIAQNSENVISCATSKVRYVGNIAADTPAGVYTTKINYLAAPQY
jgi:hypothetical protein